MLRFIKNWTLPIAMVVGTLVYLAFAKWTFLAPLKPWVNGFVSFITPWLIFAQLLFTFCKIDPKELKPRRWHAWCLARWKSTMKPKPPSWMALLNAAWMI